jgi:hypothetical protein
MAKAGRGIYSDTAAQEDDYVIHKHGTSGLYYVDRVGRNGTSVKAIGKPSSSLKGAVAEIRKEALRRGYTSGLIFEQRGDELAQIGQVKRGTGMDFETNARVDGNPEPKFKIGDLVEDIDGTRKGRVEHIRGYDDLLRGYRYMVRDTGGSRLNWNETNMRLQRGHSKNPRHRRNGGSGLHNDPALLQQLVQMAAESMELENWKDADVTPEVIRVATEYDKALEWTLDEVVLRYPPKNGASASDLWSAEAPYLVLMTLGGAGVGIWDGSWDEFYNDADIKRVQALLERKLGIYADRSGAGKLNDAFMNAAYETCGEPEQEPNASRTREAPDEQAARELSLYIENEYDLVGAPNSQGKAIEKNLLKKIKAGTFNLALSEKAWMYLMETGAKKYCKEYADSKDWSKVFNKPTRELVAHEFATTFAAEHGAKSLTRNGFLGQGERGEDDEGGSGIETEEFDAPAHWASAFINGDTSGLEEEDLAEFEAWVEANPELGHVVDVSEDTHFGRWNGLQTELATYTAHVQGS